MMATPQHYLPWTTGAHCSNIPHMKGCYFTPEERSETTGIRDSFIENLLSHCGSGCAWIFDALEGHIHESKVFRNWKALYITFEETTEEAAPATIAEKLDLIRNAFGLSMSALANVLRSSRASIYNWYEREPRSDEVLHRIDTLHDMALQWKEMNPYHYAPGKLMKQKLADGPSLLERLAQEDLDKESIQRGLEGLLVLMEKQRERMDRAKARSARVSAADESHEELLERITGSVTSSE